VSYFTIDNGNPQGYLEKASRGGGITSKNSAAAAGSPHLPFTVLANGTTDMKSDEETRACTQEESRACLQEPYAHATAGAGVYKHVVSTIIFVTT
jgi:hypothetical protein